MAAFNRANDLFYMNYGFSMPSSLTLDVTADQGVAAAACALQGIHVGALLFCSFVDTKALRKLAEEEDEGEGKEEEKKTTALETFLPVWRNAESDFMAPLTVVCAATHSACFHVTGDWSCLLSAGISLATIPYTMLFMNRDIGQLFKAIPIKGEAKRTHSWKQMLSSFTVKHHARSLANWISLCLALQVFVRFFKADAKQAAIA
mmetsp:Transcript_2483/g.5831  ORF Transcript_2483/g.5831 Transcript_2483/m.5831 type:complete len:204 (+) Transcript_2483:58-669(+)